MRNQSRTAEPDPYPAQRVACGGCGGPAYPGDRIRTGHSPALLRWRICGHCATIGTPGRAVLAAVRQHRGTKAAAAVERAGVDEVARLVGLTTIYYLNGTASRPTDSPRQPWAHLDMYLPRIQATATQLNVNQLRKQLHETLGVLHPLGLPCRVCGTTRDHAGTPVKPVDREKGWGRLVEPRPGPDTAELLAAHDRRHAAPVTGWTTTGNPPRPVCGPCATLERAARRADLLLGMTNYQEQVAAFHCWVAYGEEGDRPRAGMVRLTGWHPAADRQDYRRGADWGGAWAYLGSERDREEAHRVIRSCAGRETDEEARQRAVDAYLARLHAEDVQARQESVKRIEAIGVKGRIGRLEDGLERERQDRVTNDGVLVDLVGDMTRLPGTRR